MNTLVFIMGALILSLAALAVYFWWLYRREYNRRWDEISCAATIEKEKGKEIEELESEIDNLKWDNDCLTMTVDRQQDKLSAILCPTNNHVWQDGRCAKCGRSQG